MKKSTTKMPASFMAAIRQRYQQAIGQPTPDGENGSGQATGGRIPQ